MENKKNTVFFECMGEELITEEILLDSEQNNIEPYVKYILQKYQGGLVIYKKHHFLQIYCEELLSRIKNTPDFEKPDKVSMEEFITSLKFLIKYYEELEEYEICQIIKNHLDKIQN